MDTTAALRRLALEQRGPSTVRTRTGQGFASPGSSGPGYRRAPAPRVRVLPAPAPRAGTPGKYPPAGSGPKLAIPDILSDRDRMILESGGIEPRYSEEQIRMMRERAAQFNERGEKEFGTDAEAEQKARESDATAQFADDAQDAEFPPAASEGNLVPLILAAVAGYFLLGG